MTTVAISNGKPYFSKCKEDVLVEVVKNDVRNSAVAPASVYKHKAEEVHELTDSVVSRAHGLGAFLSSYSDTNMSFQNHWYIISSITDRESDPGSFLFT